MRLTFAVLAVSGIIARATILPPIFPSIPIVGEYKTLYDRCMAGPSDTYVSVRYQDNLGHNTYVEYSFNQCYPYSLNGDGTTLAKVAVFCRAATCNNNPNPDCSGGAVPPVPVPVPQGVVLPNIADWVQLLGQGAMCQRNGL